MPSLGYDFANPGAAYLLDGLVDPTAGAGVAARVNAIYRRRSAIADGLVADEWLKYDTAATAWTRTKRSPLLATGAWANKFPAALRARTAAQAQDVIRACLANQAAVASPSRLFYADAANTRMTEALAGDHLARTGANATFTADASYADGALVTSMHEANADHYVKASANAKYKVSTGAFALVLTSVRFTAVGSGGYWIGNYKGPGGFGQAKGWHVTVSADGTMAIGADDGTHSVISAPTGVMSDLVRRTIIIGRSITAGKLYITSSVSDTTIADTTVDISSTDSIFGFFGDLFGTAQSNGIFDCTGGWWFDTSADAETIYANRVALAATSRGLLDT